MIELFDTVAELLILIFVTLNCYVNVVRFKWDRDKRKNR